MSDPLLHTVGEPKKDLRFLYSPYLRDRIVDINPYRIPCMYSATLEDNAVTTLASISDSPDYPDILPPWSDDPPRKYQGVKEAWTLWKSPYTKTTHTTCQNWAEPEVELTTKTRSATEVKQTTSLSDLVSDDVTPRTRQTTSRPTRLTSLKRGEIAWADSSMKEDHSLDSCGHRPPGQRPLKRQQMLSGWRTCSSLHPLEQLYFSLASPVSGQRLSASSRTRRARSTSSAQRRTGATGKAVGSYENINTIQKFLQWRPGETSQKVQHKPASSMKSKSGSAPTKLPSGEKQEKQTVGPAPVPLGHIAEIPFKFEHHRSHRSYMRHYKAGFTYRKLYPTFCSPSLPGNNSKMSNLQVHCSDLRNGATLKVSQFHFKPDRLQTRTIIDNHNHVPDGEKAQTSTPSSRTTNSFLSTSSGGVLCMSLPGGNTSTTVTSSSRGSVSPPIVLRSRPSIPSNHRGVVCPTAVETPGHVIRRLGRLGSGQRRPSAKGTVDHAALQIEGRLAAKNTDTKPDKKLG